MFLFQDQAERHFRNRQKNPFNFGIRLWRRTFWQVRVRFAFMCMRQM